MDQRGMHANFVELTGCDPGLATDLLAGKQWNWDAALDYYYQIYGSDPTQKERSTYAPIKAPTQSSPASKSTPPTRQSPTANQSASSPSKRFQQLQPLPEHEVAQPTQSPMATVTSSMSNPGLMSSSLASSGGRNTDVTSSQSSDLKLVIPKPEDNAQKSPTPTRKLQRGISNANVTLVEFSRNRVTEDEQDHNHYLVDTPMYTFILPDLTLFPADFRAFMERDLLEVSTMANLENAGRLNWWAENNTCSRLWPMATTGDGNCLLHAASLGMWGFHDRQLTLRKALYHTLTQNPRSPRMQRLKRRWQLQQMEVNQKSGLVYSAEEWDQEWKALLRLASPEPRTLMPGGSRSPLPPLTENKPPTPTDPGEELTYESLEEFHVFVLAHILRRPIIVVSDTLLRDAQGEAFAPISFGGIYLPLEVPCKDCEMSPLVLTYDTAHFSALVPMEQDLEDYDQAKGNITALPVVIPITDCEHRLLPVHFAVDPGPNWKCTSSSSNKPGNQQQKSVSTADKLKLLHQYLNLIKIPMASRERGRDPREHEGAVTGNGLRANTRASSPRPEGGDRVRAEWGSFGRKLKYFAKMDKHKNDGSSTNQNAPLNEKKAGTITLAELEDQSVIVGAKMSEKRHQFQEEMIKNYIEKAKERFDEDCKQKLATKRQLQEVVRTSRFSPPLRSWDDSHINSRDPTGPGFRRQDHGYLNKQPSPDVYCHYNQDPRYLSAQQNPLTHTRSNPIPAVVQPQYIPPLPDPLGDPWPVSYQYQYGYQLGAPAEATFHANQINVPYQRQANRPSSLEDRPATIGQLVQGIHQLQPASVYQQMPAQPVSHPNKSPQIVRSTPAFPTNPPMQVPRSSPQPAYSSQVPPLTQPSKAKSGEPKITKTKVKDKISKPCKTKGCDFYGTDSTNFLCSRCYEAKIANSKSGLK